MVSVNCSNGDKPDVKGEKPFANLVVYTAAEIAAAQARGIQYLVDKKTASTSKSDGKGGEKGYPAPFAKGEELPIIKTLCKDMKWYGFPIISGRVYTGDNQQGLDRVIFAQNPDTYCGVVTHRGLKDSGLHNCANTMSKP